MNPGTGNLVEGYAAALAQYVSVPSESTLEVAYEIGRAAIAERLAMVDIAAAHQRTIAGLLADGLGLQPTVLVDRAMQFLLEALSPFEMTLRGFRQATERLEHEAAERSRAQEELRVAHDNLELRVEQRTSELFAANERLRSEVAERERAENELREANKEKDQFVAMVAHELRNPLAAVLAGADVLAWSPIEDERGRRALDVIRRNASLQKRLVDDLLAFSRLRRNTLTLQRAPVRLDLLAQTAVSSAQAEGERAGVSVQVDANAAVWVVGDADRLQQAILNLLANAIKFTPSGGRVDVGVFGCALKPHDLGPDRALDRTGRGEKASSACLVVEDSGRGIERQLLGRLFKPFQQGDVASQRQRGLGLGLALVKLITDRHGGKVWAESKGPNRGSRFVIGLPALHFERTPSQHPGRICLMLIEDSADTRLLLTTNLESAGYHVVAAGSGEEGLALLATTPADLILSDLALPGMSGCDFLQRARKIDGMGNVPAFAVTGRDTEDDLMRARSAGFDGYFVKPVDLPALDQAIRRCLAPRLERT